MCHAPMFANRKHILCMHIYLACLTAACMHLHGSGKMHDKATQAFRGVFTIQNSPFTWP